MTLDVRCFGRIRRSAIVLGCAAVVAHLPGYAQQTDPSEIAEAIRSAGRTQFVPIQINLAVQVSLGEAWNPPAAKRAAVERLEREVKQALQGMYLPSSLWSSGAGQVGMYVNRAGIERLSSIGAVASWLKDSTISLRRTVYDPDGGIARLEEAAAARGYVDVELAENLDSANYRITRAGAMLDTPSAALRSERATKRRALLESLPVGSVTALSADRQKFSTDDVVAADESVLRLRLTPDALVAIQRHPYARGVRELGVTVANRTRIDPRVLQAIGRGEAAISVLIDLHRYAGYSPKRGYMSAVSWQRQETALAGAFDEVLGMTLPKWRSQASRSEGIASLSATLDGKALQRLLDAQDPRISAVTLNEASGVALLKESVPSINVPAAVWPKYGSGAGQVIAIIDTGVDRFHPMFKDAAGVSRIVGGGCFGTNDATTVTMCPTPDASGDSLGFDAGMPFPSTYSGEYAHGTHVAGIAAGFGGTVGALVGLDGVARQAQILPGQVFSRRVFGGATVAPADILMALNQIDVLGWTNVTVNMSLGLTDLGPFDRSEGGCNNASLGVTDLISKLTSKGIPVIAATANDGYHGKIYWPSCISNVIKVGAVDDAGNIWNYSNLGDPDLFSDPQFLAPGVGVVSALPSGSTSMLSGTSMASPHVAGLYAIAKASGLGSVANITAWFMQNGTLPVHNVQMGLFPPYRYVTLYRVRIKDGV